MLSVLSRSYRYHLCNKICGYRNSSYCSDIYKVAHSRTCVSSVCHSEDRKIYGNHYLPDIRVRLSDHYWALLWALFRAFKTASII
jgi:hypothetical protein